MFASETDMMIGYHSVPVIVEAVLRGIYVPKDKAKLLRLLRTTAERKGYRGLDDYRKKGYSGERPRGRERLEDPRVRLR